MAYHPSKSCPSDPKWTRQRLQEIDAIREDSVRLEQELRDRKYASHLPDTPGAKDAMQTLAELETQRNVLAVQLLGQAERTFRVYPQYVRDSAEHLYQDFKVNNVAMRACPKLRPVEARLSPVEGGAGAPLREPSCAERVQGFWRVGKFWRKRNPQPRRPLLRNVLTPNRLFLCRRV